jgi:hypothetical protein
VQFSISVEARFAGVNGRQSEQRRGRLFYFCNGRAEADAYNRYWSTDFGKFRVEVDGYRLRRAANLCEKNLDSRKSRKVEDCSFSFCGADGGNIGDYNEYMEEGNAVSG